MEKYKFIVLGRGGLLTSIVLDRLLIEKIEPVLVIIEETSSKYPDLTKACCENYPINYQYSSNINSSEIIDLILRHSPDFVVVVSLGTILCKEILNTSLFLNVHMGILPDYKGAYTNFWKIKQGDDIFGATIHEMTTKIDSGKIIKTINRDFSHIIHGSDFIRQNYEMAASCLITCFDEDLFTAKDKWVSPIDKGKYYPKFKSEDFQIDIFEDVVLNYKRVNRMQFYGKPFFVENDKEVYINSISLLYKGSHSYETNIIKHINEKTKLVYCSSGIIEINCA